jgi:mRNA interferase RelE/StbE
MNYTVKVGRTVEKFLRGLTDKKLYYRLREAIDGLANEPRPADSAKLKGVDDLYRARVGDYRIVYQIRDRELLVLVVQIGLRREIYR